MPGDPQPVIYYHGNKSLFDLIISKELSERLIGLQNVPASRPDDIVLTGSFSSICRGFCFLPYNSIIEEEQERITFYTEPCLHLYWTDCCDQEQYKTSVKPEITKWIGEVERINALVGWLIVYCITKESKSKRKQQQLGEKIKNDFCSKPEQYCLLKLASSDTSRVLDSWSALVTRINTLTFNTFQRNMQPYIDRVNEMTDKFSSEETYSYFLNKLDVAIGYEMSCQYELALRMYNDLHLLLERAIGRLSSESRSQYPQWLKKLTSSWYQCWDCPNLTRPEKAWKYIVPIHSGSAPLLVIRTFIFMRESSLLSMLCRSWLLAERALQVLHSAARELRAIKFNYPEGIFEAWAFMTCMETVSAILSQFSRANPEDITSSLLLIRASLWEYGLQKLHKLGKICQLLPSSDEADAHLISRITSGITPLSSHADDHCEDQGRVLLEVLESKQSFTAKYLELGEMVIGAFKHAGRKRTAFTMGLQIAKFQMELGLITEAEQLLNDTCSLYCPERWTMFTANAVTLLAECQKSLNLDSKYLRSLLLLAMLPPVVGTSHDPNDCLDEVIQLSKSKQSDVITLDWSPLFSVVKVAPDNSEYIVSNVVTVTVSLLYHGQKDLSVDNLSLLMRTSIKSLIQSPETPAGPSLCSGLVQDIASIDIDPILTPIPPESLYDLDIDSNCSDSSDYRPLHDLLHHKRRTLSETYSSYSLDRFSTGVDGAFEEESNEPEFVISTSNIVLHPGENELKLHGEPLTSGQYYGRKLTLSIGRLSFVSMVTSAQWSKGVPVLLKPIEISFGLEPELGALYAGLVQKCKLILKTGPENSITQDSILNLSCSTGIKFILEPDSTERLSELTLSLPAIGHSSEWSEVLLLYLPSIYKEPEMLMSDEDNFVFYPSKQPTAWNHELLVGCHWLMPPHVATLPITSPEPLSIDHQIWCVPDRSFLQFIVTSHWPHGVKLSEGQLSVPKSVSSEPLQVPTPEVLWDEENFSYLWELQCIDVDTVIEDTNVKCLFDLNSQLLMDNVMDHLSIDHRYPFGLPGVNALYCIESTVEPVSSDRVIESNLCQLKIVIRCCAPLGTDCPKKFRYTILYDDVYWHIPHGVNGTAPIEKASRTVQIKVDIVPQMYGELPVPIVSITEHSRRRTSVRGSGQEDIFVLVDKSVVYNSSHGMRIYVYSDSRYSS